MEDNFVLKNLRNLALAGLSYMTSSPYFPKGNSYAERAVGVVKEVYTKCGSEFLLEILVHQATPLSSGKSPAQLFCGQKFATNIPSIPYGTTAIVQCSDSPTCVRWFDPQDGDHCYICINPNMNEWVKGTIVRQVIRVPNSFVVNVDGHKYR